MNFLTLKDDYMNEKSFIENTETKVQADLHYLQGFMFSWTKAAVEARQASVLREGAKN